MSATGKRPNPTNNATNLEREYSGGIPELVREIRDLRQSTIKYGQGPQVDTVKGGYIDYPTGHSADLVRQDARQRDIQFVEPGIKGQRQTNVSTLQQQIKEILDGVTFRSGFVPNDDTQDFTRSQMMFMIGDIMHCSGGHLKHTIKTMLQMLSKTDRERVMEWLQKDLKIWKAKNRNIDWAIIAAHLVLHKEVDTFPAGIELPAAGIEHLQHSFDLREVMYTKSPASRDRAHILRTVLTSFLFDRSLATFAEEAKNKGAAGTGTGSSYEALLGLYPSLMRNLALVMRVVSAEEASCERNEAMFIPMRNMVHGSSNYHWDNVVDRLEKGRIAGAAHAIIDGTDRQLKSRTENKLVKLCKKMEDVAANNTSSNTLLSTHERVRNSSGKITKEEITLSAELVGSVEWIVTWMFLLPDHKDTTWYYKDGLQWNDASLEGVDVRPVTFCCTPGSSVASTMFSLAHVNTRDVQLVLRAFCRQYIIDGAVSYNFPGFRNMKLVFEEINKEMANECDKLAKPLKKVLLGLGCGSSGSGGGNRVALPANVYNALNQKIIDEKNERLNDIAQKASQKEGGRRGGRNAHKRRKTYSNK